jgi:hypothetical protein
LRPTAGILERLRAGALAGATRFDLPAGTGYFPREIFNLADTLEILDISGNDLDALPADFARFTRLRILFSSNNRFTRLPDVLGDCPRLSLIGFKSNRIATVPAEALPPGLRWLILTDNRIAELPPSLAACRGLRKLALAGNQLTAVPEELRACRDLELLRISANRLTAIPGWLTDLPRLAWLAYAGNPCTAPAESTALAQHDLPVVPWSDLTLGAQLGAGASGVISRAALSSGDEVAIKLFKAGVTSDGYPQSELAASIAAGRQAQLITAQGTIGGHPAGTPGLVLPLLANGFRALAGPPSLESCTRDVYASDVSFTVASAHRLLHGVATAGAHLHARGVLHGDLYAHNLLHDGHGAVHLGDFGAATLYDRSGQAARVLERLDVRAFGCLMEEVLARMLKPSPIAWQQLRDRCLSAIVSERPDFAGVRAALVD